MSEAALMSGAGARSGEAPLALRALAGGPADAATMQSVLAAAPGYFEAIQGGPAGPAEGVRVFTDLPPGRSYADKIVYGLCAGDKLIGCADVVRGWNAADKAIIGLLLLAEAWQGRGLGRAFAALVEQAIGGWPEIATVRVGVVAANVRALAFWRRLGYRETGERTRNHAFVADILVLEKPLHR
jgi:GNAT superfamily N-acetyltransferase